MPREESPAPKRAKKANFTTQYEKMVHPKNVEAGPSEKEAPKEMKARWIEGCGEPGNLCRKVSGNIIFLIVIYY